jgi:CHAT domain-containing protein
VTLLTGGDAREQAYRRLAAEHSWHVLATHGFFAGVDPSSPAAGEDMLDLAVTQTLFDRGGVSRGYPDLRVGLVFAGANREAVEDLTRDGLLTAAEMAGLDLSQVDTAVLSACETALGKEFGGEGMLGLQRAFHVAGARTVVSSLWEVHDRTTQVLMERFHRLVWKDKRGRLQALREAQLWMLRDADAVYGAGLRGAEPAESGLLPAAGRLPPYYWAAFVLSGDWR